MRRLEQERIEGAASPSASAAVEVSPYQQAIESLKRWPSSKQPFQYRAEIDKLLIKHLS
jgi:hypothetical protein